MKCEKKIIGVNEWKKKKKKKWKKYYELERERRWNIMQYKEIELELSVQNQKSSEINLY